MGLGLAGPAAADATDPWAALVDRGAGLWHRSPDPEVPVACATCHRDLREAEGWVVSYPRYRPLPPPHGRVMTLLQALAEASSRHYRGLEPLASGTALAAYLLLRTEGRSLTPGRTPGEPAFPGRLAALRASAARGAARFRTRCGGCHEADVVAPAALGWARLVRVGRGPTERFLETHGLGAPWDSPEVADLLAYLAGRRAGQPLVVDPAGAAREGTR